MPIIIPKGLPAYKSLSDEKIFVMDEARAVGQDIRPIEIAHEGNNRNTTYKVAFKLASSNQRHAHQDGFLRAYARVDRAYDTFL